MPSPCLLALGNCNTQNAQLSQVHHLARTPPPLLQGLMPLFISPRTGNFTARRVSLGALGDSYYEVGAAGDNFGI